MSGNADDPSGRDDGSRLQRKVSQKPQLLVGLVYLPGQNLVAEFQQLIHAFLPLAVGQLCDVWEDGVD
jgi:hypothetical protein